MRHNHFNQPHEIHDERRRVSQLTTSVSMVVNLMISTIQLVIGFIAHSQGLIADAIHSYSDLISDLVVLVATRQASRAPDQSHPYGHQRFETLASMIIGMILALVGLGMIYKSLHILLTPHLQSSVHMTALWTALLVIASKESLFRYMLYHAKRVHSSLLIANAWHARSDAISSLVVAVGVIGNLIGCYWADALAAFFVGAMIIHLGLKFSVEASKVLTDHAADEETIEAIRQAILSVEGISGVHDIKTRQSGDQVLVEAHLEFPAHMSVQEAHELGTKASESARKKVPSIAEIITHFDPI